MLVPPFAYSPILASFCRLLSPLNLRPFLQTVVLSLQRLALSEQSPRVGIKYLMSMGEPHEHGSTACAYKGVKGVNTSYFVDF
jgi:hypothetical protein